MSSAPTVRPPRASTDALLVGVCMLCLAACAWWAMNASHGSKRAGQPAHTDSITAAADDRPNADTLIALDLAAFRTPIWVAPPLPPAPPKSASTPKPEPPLPPPPPLKWQLLAIVRASGGAPAHAMIYDPESDAVIELAAGDTHTGAMIEAVRDDRVIIRRGRHTHTLLLDPRLAATSGTTEAAP